MNSDRSKIFMGILALLSLVIVVQSYFLYDLSQSIKADKPVQSPALVVKKDTMFNAHNSDPFKQMQRMQEQMHKSFGEFNSIFANDPFFKEAYSQMPGFPLSDIQEDDTSYRIELNIPGSKEQNIEIKNQGNTLSVFASSQSQNEDNQSNYIHKERYSSSFSRSFTLPEDADLNNLTHHYDNGVLKIEIPKKS